MEYAAYEKCGIQVYCSYACLTSSVLVSLPSAQNSIVRREQKMYIDGHHCNETITSPPERVVFTLLVSSDAR